MKTSNQRGTILLVALGVVSVVSLFALVAVENISFRSASLRNSAHWQRALAIADAGVESAIHSLKKDSSFKEEKDVPFDGGSFTTEIGMPELAGDVRIIRSRSLFRPGGRGSFRKELLVVVRLSEGRVEILSRDERTPTH